MLKTKEIIIVLAILNLAVFGSYFYLFAKVKRMDETVSARLIQVESEAKRDGQLRSIKSLMNDTKKEREQIINFFVGPAGSVDFIETVEFLGRVADVNLEVQSVGIDTLKNKISSSTEPFRLSLKTEGSWSNTIHLLNLLESMPFKVSFDNISLEKISEASDPVKNKEKSSIYWIGSFGFSVLKIKNLSQDSAS